MYGAKNGFVIGCIEVFGTDGAGHGNVKKYLVVFGE
jgi:hypothetical protein